MTGVLVWCAWLYAAVPLHEALCWWLSGADIYHGWPAGPSGASCEVGT